MTVTLGEKTMQDYPGAAKTAGEVRNQLDRLEKSIEVLAIELDTHRAALALALTDDDPAPGALAVDKRQSPASELGRHLDMINDRLEERIAFLRNITRRVAL